MNVGIASDHGGFTLKRDMMSRLREAGYVVQDFGSYAYEKEDDYPDYIIPMAQSVAQGRNDRGVAICGSGVGACIAANKIPGARACLITDIFSAHQGVEDDDMNILCLGGWVTGDGLAWELVQSFLSARYRKMERFQRRLDKIAVLEGKQ